MLPPSLTQSSGQYERSFTMTTPWRCCRYMGSQGIYTHTVEYERDADCPICSAGVQIEAEPDATLQQVSVMGGWMDNVTVCSVPAWRMRPAMLPSVVQRVGIQWGGGSSTVCGSAQTVRWMDGRRI